MSRKINAAADLLLSARRSGQALQSLPPELLPDTPDEAYAIQDLVTAASGAIGGWKTAPSKDGVKFNWAPIPAEGVFMDNANVPLAAFPRCELELEVCFLVAESLPQRDHPYERDEVIAALGELRVCLELFSSRYADRRARSPLEVLADGQNAAGVVIGTGLADWTGFDLGTTSLTLDYLGETHRQAGGRLLDDLLDACTDLANGSARLGGLQAGHVIITGARIGPIAASAAGQVHGKIEPIGTVSASLI